MSLGPVNGFITKEFLENLLGQNVVNFKIDIGSKPGDNVAGLIYSITIFLEDKNLNLVLKTLPEETSTARKFVMKYDLFKTEIGMYSKIVPVLENLALKKGITLPFPKFYGGNFEGENQWLALEDLRHISPPYKMINKYEGLNFNEAVVAFGEIGKFHALTYYLLKYHGESFLVENEIFENYGNLMNKNKKSRLNNLITIKRFGTAFNLGVEKVSEVNEKLAQKLKSAYNSTLISDYLIGLSSLTDTKYFPVILHGDFWSNNFLFQMHVDGSLNMKFVDFQLSRRGNIFEELHYFILTSLTPSLRKENLLKFLEIYYDSFIRALKKLNFPPPYNFTKGFLIDGVEELYSVKSLVMLTHAIPLQLGISSIDEKQEVIEKKCEKNKGVEESSRENESPPSHEDIIENMMKELRMGWESNPATIERFVSILKEFEEKGVI